MEKPFILNPTLNLLEIKDAMDERFSKLKGVLNCLMFAVEFVQGDDELDNDSAYHALWAIDGFVDEIYCLKQKLDNMIN
jgi:hypothetical protein